MREQGYRRGLSGLLVAASVCLGQLVMAESATETLTAEERGRAIAVEADRRASGFVDSESLMTMILRDRRGNERTRQMRSRALERDDDGDWGMTIFDEPADVSGTAMLSYSHGLEPDDQWLYLPALKRVKHISSRNRSGPFMGSEFAFEDLSAFEVEKFSYKFLREEACGQLQCFVSEWVPLYENSGYTRMEVWVDTAEYRSQKTVYFGRRGDLLKTLTFSEYKLYNDRFWRAMKMEMENHVKGKSTVLKYKNYVFGAGLTERDFDQAALKRAK